MITNIQVAADPKRQDFYLDQFADSLLRATEWDAEQWGFDADRWMETERIQLAERGGRFWPKEPMMRVTACKND